MKRELKPIGLCRTRKPYRPLINETVRGNESSKFKLSSNGIIHGYALTHTHTHTQNNLTGALMPHSVAACPLPPFLSISLAIIVSLKT